MMECQLNSANGKPFISFPCKCFKRRVLFGDFIKKCMAFAHHVISYVDCHIN